jgi:hypothetical protein
MRLTVITNSSGEVIATHRGHSSKDKLQAGLRAGPNQTLHEIEVPDEFDKITNPDELHTRVKSHMHKS